MNKSLERSNSAKMPLSLAFYWNFVQRIDSSGILKQNLFRIPQPFGFSGIEEIILFKEYVDSSGILKRNFFRIPKPSGFSGHE